MRKKSIYTKKKKKVFYTCHDQNSHGHNNYVVKPIFKKKNKKKTFN